MRSHFGRTLLAIGCVLGLAACASTGTAAVETAADVALAPLDTSSAMRRDQVELRSQAIGAIRDIGVADAN
ncbi:MAG: hypothetical protein AAB815_03775, partial [Patescibacteria group bacterium]